MARSKRNEEEKEQSRQGETRWEIGTRRNEGNEDGDEEEDEYHHIYLMWSILLSDQWLNACVLRQLYHQQLLDLVRIALAAQE